jgi:hypothetical protein
MCRAVSILLLLSACTTQQRQDPPTPRAVDQRYLDPAVTANALATLYPWRALQVQDGALRLEPDGAAANVFDGASMELPVMLVDQGTHGARSRLFVLCDNPSSRVALYLDQTDVAPVAANGTIMVTSSSVPATVLPTTPAFHIHPGTPVEAGAFGPRGTRFITVNGLRFRAQGYVRASKVGFAWREEPPAAADEQTDLEIPNGVTFLDAPGGRVLATLEAYPSTQTVHFATRLGEPDSGHVLVRFSNALGVLVGWVRMEHVRPSPPAAWGSGAGGLAAKGPAGPRLELACGTALVDGQGRPVGVTTAKDGFVCEGDCGARPARVWVPACNTRVLVTVSPQQVRPCPPAH